MASLRRRAAALVGPPLFPALLCPGRLRPQTASQAVLAALSSVLRLGHAGGRPPGEPLILREHRSPAPGRRNMDIKSILIDSIAADAIEVPVAGHLLLERPLF